MEKKPRDPRKMFAYYYIIALVIVMVFNFLAIPFLKERQVKLVDYGTFMTMTDNHQIGKVDIQSNRF